MSEPANAAALNGPFAKLLDDLYHTLGDDAAVEKEVRNFSQTVVKPAVLKLSPLPDFADSLLYVPLENAVVAFIKYGHQQIHQD